jgi:hypothetical protein
MSVTTAQSVLLWCILINVGGLMLWGLLIVLLPHEWLHRLWGRWLRISPEQFDTVNFAGIVFYEILIFVFNVVPYIALLIAG